MADLHPAVTVAVIMNNYFHDVATAFLFASALIMWGLVRRAERTGGAAVEGLRCARPMLTKLAIGALAWIVVGGIPRTIFFTRVEYDPGKVPGLVVALGVKHALMFTAVAVGVWLWRRADRLLRSPESPVE